MTPEQEIKEKLLSAIISVSAEYSAAELECRSLTDEISVNYERQKKARERLTELTRLMAEFNTPTEQYPTHG
jgi:hypothetical protein